MPKKLPPVLLLVVLILGLVVSTGVSQAEEDKATWYGPGFHGRVMANGQIYDMYDPTTTASNRFPFGTWVKVTSVRTGRSVIVQVRDRGAFTHAFDLSYAAFAAIDDPALMVIKIRYEVVPASAAPTPRPVATPQATATPQPTATPTPAPAPVQATPPPTPVPAPPATATPVPSGAIPNEHVVQPGETLSTIAARYGLRKDTLIELNGLENANFIKAGQRLKLRGAPAATPQPTRSPAPTPSGRQHVVEPGQTLGEIAERYGVSMATIISGNGLGDPNYLFAGQKLMIPGVAAAPVAPPQPASNSGGRYVVVAGDSLSVIAEKTGTSVVALMSANDLTNADTIYVGQELRLPSGAVASSPPPTPQTYVVQAGDTLSGIALANGTTVEHLLTLNGLDDSDYLIEGQTLKVTGNASLASRSVPSTRSEPVTYVIEPGDSLSLIAELHQTTVAQLVALNDLENEDQIYPGDRLRVR